MGVVNVTPDSFSDGGEFLDPRSAVEHAYFDFKQRYDQDDPATLCEVAKDIAVIAAALANSERKVTPATASSNGPSRWVMSGRSGLNGR